MSKRALVAFLARRSARAGEAAWGFVEEDIEIRSPAIDARHDGVVVAQLSDIHVGMHTPDGRILAAIAAINRRQPDLVVLTGDYVTRRGDPLERVPDLLKNLAAPAIAVLGNHDHWTDGPTIARDLRSVDIEVLQNRNTCIPIRGAPLWVLGIDDAISGHADVEATFHGVPSTGSRLVLLHAPPVANMLPQAQGLICLSGHTHGGQVYVPQLTERLFAKVGQPFVRGHYAVQGNFLYVNRGLGFGKGGPFPRVGSEPELTFLTLRAAA